MFRVVNVLFMEYSHFGTMKKFKTNPLEPENFSHYECKATNLEVIIEVILEEEISIRLHCKLIQYIV